MNESIDREQPAGGPTLRWAITLLLILVLVYPVALWVRNNPHVNVAGSALPKADTLLQLSVDHYQAGRYQQAIDAARTALAENPELAEAWNNIAVSLLQLGRYDEGIEAAHKALELQPTFELARNNLEWLERQKAIAATEAEVEVLMRQGIDELYTQANPRAAAELFRHVLELNPDHYGANYQLAAALQQAGQLEDARGQWLRVLDMARAMGDTDTEALVLPYLDDADQQNQ